jgi:hypothetical protein
MVPNFDETMPSTTTLSSGTSLSERDAGNPRHLVEHVRALAEDPVDRDTGPLPGVPLGPVDIEFTVESFLLAPFLLQGTDLVAVVPERAAGHLRRTADVRFLEGR